MNRVTWLRRAIILGVGTLTLAGCGSTVAAAAPSGAVLTAATTGPCTAPVAGVAGSISLNIATASGCDVIGAPAATPITGFITVHFAADTSTGSGVLALGQPAGSAYVAGKYTVTLTSCAGGSATGASYTVSAGSYPTLAVSSPTDPLKFTASATAGTVSCAYTFTASPALNGTESFAVDAFVNIGSCDCPCVRTNGATVAVSPPGPPPVLPEAPLAILLPLAAVGILGFGFYRMMRRPAPDQH
jgi:hypothetical protein